MYLVDYTVFARILTGLDGYMPAFEWVNKNVGSIATLDTIYIDTVEYSYILLNEYPVEFEEVFLRLSNVLRSLIDSTVTRFIPYRDYVEEAMHLSSDKNLNPRDSIYLVASRDLNMTLVTMNEKLRGFDNVVIIPIEE